MKFIELNNTKLNFFYSEVPYIACDGIVNINPFLVEAVVEKYLWGKDKPFVVSIRLSSGRYYDVMFASTLKRDMFIKEVKNIIIECFEWYNKPPITNITNIVESEERNVNKKGAEEDIQGRKENA